MLVKMVSNLYLNEIASSIPTYRGTFSCDDLINVETRPGMNTCIVNLSRLGETGSHFTAVSINIPSTGEPECSYFDSFGIECGNDYIKSYIRSFSHSYSYSTVQLQPYTSQHCGLYCLAYVITCEMGKDMLYFLEHFNSTDIHANDRIVTNYINHYFKSINKS